MPVPSIDTETPFVGHCRSGMTWENLNRNQWRRTSPNRTAIIALPLTTAQSSGVEEILVAFR
jgi:hypothetical protein